MTRASNHDVRRTNSAEAKDLVQHVVDALKPHYEMLLKRAHKTEADAYSLAYGRAVALLAKAHRTTDEKTKFLYRNELQTIMNRVTE